MLTLAQAKRLYDAIAGSGNGAEGEVTKIVYNAVEQRIEITFNTLRDRDYALWDSPDLIVWAELNDAIPSQGTETTYFVDSVILPDPASPRNFYQVREPE